jgi:thioredoxin 1
MTQAPERLQTLLQSDTPVLIDCFATWCGPCKMMPPILREVKDRMGDQLRIIQIDVDKNPALAQQWQVSGVPTLLLFRKGQLKWRQSGVVPAAELLRIIKPFLS